MYSIYVLVLKETKESLACHMQAMIGIVYDTKWYAGTVYTTCFDFVNLLVII